MTPTRWLGLLTVVLALAPLVLPPFFLQLLTEIAIVGLFATAFNLLMGFGGMVSFGHAAYFALGASRKPSSRSMKRGTKNSFVKVVSCTRPSAPCGTTLS